MQTLKGFFEVKRLLIAPLRNNGFVVKHSNITFIVTNDLKVKKNQTPNLMQFEISEVLLDGRYRLGNLVRYGFF